MEASPEGARIKGFVKTRFMFLRERGGEELAAEVLTALSKEDREALTNSHLAVSWCSVDLARRFDQTIVQVLRPADRAQMFREMGRTTAEQNLTSVHSAFLHRRDPHHLLGLLPRLYAQQHTQGARTYEKLGERVAGIRTSGAPAVSTDDCLTVVGWLKRAIELCGGTSVDVSETRCHAAGATHCEYLCSWK